MGYIYKITNSVNGKIYVGKTSRTVERRWKDHTLLYKQKRNYKSLLYDAMSKYGVENFLFEVIEECPNEQLNDRERFWIDELDTHCNGYNLTAGGDGYARINKEERAKIIDLWKSGLTQAEICKVVNHERHAVKEVLYDGGITRNEIVARTKERNRLLPHYMTGVQPSTYICSYDRDGNFLKEYSSIKMASEDIGVHHTTIGHALRENKHLADGTQFRDYKSDKVEPIVHKKHRCRIPVYQYSLDGDYIAEFSTPTEASNALGLCDTHGITKSCDTELSTCGGYQWRRYKTDKVSPVEERYRKRVYTIR